MTKHLDQDVGLLEDRGTLRGQASAFRGIRCVRVTRGASRAGFHEHIETGFREGFLSDATTLTAHCLPASMSAGGSATCSATVVDPAVSGASTPTGEVSFASNGGGAFDSTECELVAAGVDEASCSVIYTAAASSVGAQMIHVTYGGDWMHDPSEGATRIVVRHGSARRH